MLNLICDKDGVPELVQNIRFKGGAMLFEVELFNGKFAEFTPEMCGVDIDIMNPSPRHLQWLQAENFITKYVLRNFEMFR